MARSQLLVGLALVTVVACGGSSSKNDDLFAGGGTSNAAGNGDSSGTGASGGDDGANGGASSGGGDGTPSASGGGGGTGDAGATGTSPGPSSSGGTSSGGTSSGGADASALTCTTQQAGTPALGVAQFTVDTASFALPLKQWAADHNSVRDDLTAQWGAACPGELDLVALNAIGKQDVTQRMNGGTAEGPRIVIHDVDGTTWEAGWDVANGCAPCGSGNVTVSNFISGGGANGTFDVLLDAVPPTGGGQKRAAGTWSFHH